MPVRFARLKSIGDLNLLPGAVKYGDLPALLALAAPTELWITGEGAATPAVVTAAYSAAKASGKLHGYQVPAGAKADQAIGWSLK